MVSVNTCHVSHGAVNQSCNALIIVEIMELCFCFESVDDTYLV